MSALARLKALRSGENLEPFTRNAPTKPTKPPFVGSVGSHLESQPDICTYETADDTSAVTREPPTPVSVHEWFRERLAIICEASELDPDEVHALAVDRTLRHFWNDRAAIVQLLTPSEA